MVVDIWTHFRSFLLSFFASFFCFSDCCFFSSILLSASVVGSEVEIASGFGGGSSCTGAGSDNRLLGSQFSSSDTARKS